MAISHGPYILVRRDKQIIEQGRRHRVVRKSLSEKVT